MTQEQKIQEHIAQIIPAADFFPGIVVVHDLRTLGVEYMSQLGLLTLNTTLPELRALGSNYHQKYFNPRDAEEYVPKLASMLRRNNDGEIISFFQQVRANEHHDWTWYLSTVRIFMRDERGQPLLALTFACPLNLLNHLTPKIKHLLEEQTFLRKNQRLFAQLTRRERQVLQLLAQGKNSVSIADELYISANTVITHRRNINAKLHPHTQQDLTRYAHAFDLV